MARLLKKHPASGGQAGDDPFEQDDGLGCKGFAVEGAKGGEVGEDGGACHEGQEGRQDEGFRPCACRVPMQPHGCAGRGMYPSNRALRRASARLLARSLAYMFFRWSLTVWGLIERASAISL